MCVPRQASGRPLNIARPPWYAPGNNFLKVSSNLSEDSSTIIAHVIHDNLHIEFSSEQPVENVSISQGPHNMRLVTISQQAARCWIHCVKEIYRNSQISTSQGPHDTRLVTISEKAACFWIHYVKDLHSWLLRISEERLWQFLKSEFYSYHTYYSSYCTQRI